MENNYKVAYYKEWDNLKKLNLNEVVNITNVEYCKEKNQLKVPFFEQYYILDINNETIYRQSDSFIPSIDASIMILNYLTFSKSLSKTNDEWVSLKDIPNGGALFYPAFYKSSILKLIDKFGYNCEKLKQSAQKLNGIPNSLGNISYTFKAFPNVSLCVAIWEGDEEILPNATILYQPSIQYSMHIESIIGLGCYITNELICKI